MIIAKDYDHENCLKIILKPLLFLTNFGGGTFLS